MEKQFVNYELALKLKELGFKEKCIKGFYNKEEIYTTVDKPVDFNSKIQSGEIISCPLWQQVVDWFEETHGIHISTTKYLPFKLKNSNFFSWYVDCKENDYRSLTSNLTAWVGLNANLSYHVCNTKREALMAAIDEAFEILEKRNARKISEDQDNLL